MMQQIVRFHLALTPLPSPPPQGGREQIEQAEVSVTDTEFQCQWRRGCKSPTDLTITFGHGVPSPLAGEGQGGGYAPGEIVRRLELRFGTYSNWRHP